MNAADQLLEGASKREIWVLKERQLLRELAMPVVARPAQLAEDWDEVDVINDHGDEHRRTVSERYCAAASARQLVTSPRFANMRQIQSGSLFIPK